MRTSLFFGLLALPLVLGAHLRLTIPSSPRLPQPSTQLSPSTHATLTTFSRVHSAPLTTNNAFDFRNVSAGSYLLDVHCHSHAFAPLRVDVSPSGAGEDEKVEVWGTFRGNEWSNKGEKVVVTEADDRAGLWLFEGKVLAMKEYLVERVGFSPLSYLKNPMILIAGVCMLFIFGMPYVMDTMDDEMKIEYEAWQKTPSRPAAAAKPLQDFDAAAWLAGSSTPKRSETAVEKGVTR